MLSRGRTQLTGSSVGDDRGKMYLVNPDFSTVTALQAVPGVDSTDNVNARDVSGNKDDTLIDELASDVSNIAYTKGLVNVVQKLRTAKIYQGSAAGTGWADIVNLTDKGILSGISFLCMAFTAQGYGQVDVNIDGVTLISAAFLWFTKIGDSRALPCILKFETSLVVKVKINAGSLGTVQGMCAVSID